MFVVEASDAIYCSDFVSEFGSRDGDDHGTKCVKGEQL
jgi:hypothetical protein